MSNSPRVGALRRAVLLPLVAGLSALPAAAGHGPEEAADTAKTEIRFHATTTVTATGNERDTFEVATPVSVLRDLAARPADSAADLLRDLPGVDVNGVGPNQARPIIRGQRGLRVLFLDNGLRMNNARRQTDFGEITGLVSIDSVDAVEVVRGPASVLYGSDAIGGVLNLLPRMPGFGAPNSLGGDVKYRYSTADAQSKGAFNLHGQAEDLAFSLGVSYRSAADYEAPDGSFGAVRLQEPTRVIDSGVDDSSIFANLAYRLSPEHTVYTRYNRYRAENSGFGLVEPELIGGSDPSRVRIVYPFQDFDKVSVGYLGSTLGLPFVDGAEIQAYYQSNERELRNDIDIDIGPVFPGAPNSAVEADTSNLSDVDTFGFRIELTKSIGDSQVLTYGSEFYQDDSVNSDFSTTTVRIRLPFPPFEQVDVSTDDLANAPNASNRGFGLFLQDEWFVNDRLNFTVGGRFQRAVTEAKATPGWDIGGLDFDDQRLVGAVSARYKLTDQLNLLASFGTAFRAPNIIERLFNGLTPEGIGFQLLNRDLESERSREVDLGIKYQSQNAQLEVVYFKNDIEDGIVQHFLTAGEIAALDPAVRAEAEGLGVDFIVQQRNVAELQYEGVEIAGGYRFPHGFTVAGNYTHLDSSRLDAANPPTGDTYDDKLTFEVRYDHPSERFWVGYHVRHNGEADVNLEAGQPVPAVGLTLPSFTVQRLSAGVKLFELGRQRHRFECVLDNLTDELFAEFSNATFFRPQAGRNLIATYRVAF